MIRPTRKGRRYTRVARLNIIPDIDERMLEIAADPVRLGYFLAIRQLVGEGNDQFVDDMFSTNDGRLLIVSRPSLRDVVAIDIASGEIVWRFVVDGQRSDHMAISPDGKHVAVSASTGNVVHILDTATGEEIGRFESGDSPAREQLLRRRRAHLPRLDRPRLHPRRRSAGRHAARATATSRSSTPTRTRSSSGSTWARSSRRPATRT